MTRLTLRLTELHVQTIDWIMSGDDSYRPDARHRGHAVEQIILSYAGELRDRAAAASSNDSTPRRDGSVPDRRDRSNALRTLERLRKSRDRYRDLAARIEAALLGLPPRDDFGGLERRIERALAEKGIHLPARPRPEPAHPGRGKSARRRP